MLSIAGMLGPETLVEPKKSPGGVQQQIPPLPRSSPESQPIREQGRGDSPRDRQGLGALLEATGVGCTSSPKGSQSPPLPPPPTTTKMASSQTFTQHGTEVNTFFNSSHRSSQQPAMINDFPKNRAPPAHPSCEI